MPVNPDLQRERDRATFEPLELTYFLDEGKEHTDRRRYIENIVKTDPELRNAPNNVLLSQEENYKEGLRRVKIFSQRVKELNITNPQDLNIYNRAMFSNNIRPDGIHYGVFLPTIQRQMSDEQLKKWLPLAQNYRVIGTYAQTELGHGTYLRGLETEAKYDPSTEEFIIHSPTVSSTKFWPGGIGKTCNYAIVMATLHLGGKNRGMHPFLVQLRDLDTHVPCKGVQLGDMGPKIGFHSIDNGYARFNHVRIPRENLLMKYTKVSPSGEYERVGAAKMSYFSMIYLRAAIVRDPAALGLSQAVTIAVRYSAVRRQSEMNPGEVEPQVLDYQTQQYKVLPALATAYAFQFVSKYIKQLFNDIEKEILQNKFGRLPELHAMAAGLKAFSTYTSCGFIEQLRLACGGHGYSQASGLPAIYAHTTPSCTYEGENTILYLQTARYLMKVFQQVQEGNSGQFAGTTVEYVSKQLPSTSALKEDMELNQLLEAYEYRAKYRISMAASCILGHVTSGKDQLEATQLSTVKLVKAAEAHSHLCALQTFMYALNQSTDTIKPVLTRLCRLYAVYGIVECSGDFIINGYLSTQQISTLEAAMFNLLTDIRTDAVALVDAFDFPDFLLNSSLGRFDGNVYESIMEFTEQSPLNKTDVHETFEKYIKPMRQILSSRL